MKGIKKITGLLFICAMLLIPTRFVHANSLVINPDFSSVSVGDPVSLGLYVDITDGSDLYAAVIELLYDPAILSFTGASEGNFLTDFGGCSTPPCGSDTFFQADDDPLLGSLLITNNLVFPVSGATSSAPGWLATLDFMAIGEGTSLVEFSFADLATSYGSYIIADNFNGEVNVTAAVPEPATLILMGSGLAGLALFKRRNSNV